VLQVGQQLDVAVDVPESLVNRLAIGDAAEVSIAALPGPSLRGKVHEVGLPQSGAAVFPISVRLDDPPQQVRPAMAAEVTFELRATSTAAEGIVVPASAVGEDRQGRFVFVLEDAAEGTGVVQRKAVQVGAVDSAGIHVTSGLDPGAKLVTAGVHRIHDGLKVRVPPLVADTAASAAAERGTPAGKEP
jgi:RND family efflux transporter MFP subunit